MIERFTFRKNERLNSKLNIARLFNEGKSFNCFPLKVIYHIEDADFSPSAQVLISIPKKSFKSAVKRNLLKRRIREAYRLNKRILNEELLQKKKMIYFAIIYISDATSDFKKIELKVIEIITLIKGKL